MKRGYELSMAVPASLVSDVPHLREKSLKIGLIGRAAAIFGVNEVIVFPDLLDVDQSREASLISIILSYMDTPQYLRRRLFKIRPELRYAGILPPLRTPHHPLTSKIKGLTVGEHREGAVVSSTRKGALVEIGVERPVLVPHVRLPINRRVTVRILELGKHPVAALADREAIEEYWGYRVTLSDAPLGRLLKDQVFDLVIATSRHGSAFMDVVKGLVERWKRSQRIVVLFGAPTQGLYEILSRDGVKLDDVADFAVNTIPNQWTETVRTEEAVYASLAILNLFACSDA